MDGRTNKKKSTKKKQYGNRRLERRPKSIDRE